MTGVAHPDQGRLGQNLPIAVRHRRDQKVALPPQHQSRHREGLSRGRAGVAVITTRDSDGPVGFCATSLTSVSLDPPTVSFAVAIGSASGQAWERTGQGIVHLLRSDQVAVASNFARSGPDKFDAIDWRWGPNAQPPLDHVLAWMLVSARIRVVVGDHLLIVCDVREVAVASGG